MLHNYSMFIRHSPRRTIIDYRRRVTEQKLQCVESVHGIVRKFLTGHQQVTRDLCYTFYYYASAAADLRPNKPPKPLDWQYRGPWSSLHKRIAVNKETATINIICYSNSIKGYELGVMMIIIVEWCSSCRPSNNTSCDTHNMEDEMRMRLKCVQLSSSLAAVPFLIFNELTILNTHCMQITVVMNQILNYRYQYQDLKTFQRREMEGNRVCVAWSKDKSHFTVYAPGEP